MSMTLCDYAAQIRAHEPTRAVASRLLTCMMQYGYPAFTTRESRAELDAEISKNSKFLYRLDIGNPSVDVLAKSVLVDPAHLAEFRRSLPAGRNCNPRQETRDRWYKDLLQECPDAGAIGANRSPPAPPSNMRSSPTSASTTRKPKVPYRDKGSKRHILDLVSSDEFEATVNALLASSGVRLAAPCYQRPASRRNPDEWFEYELEAYMRAFPLSSQQPLDPQWWIRHKTALNKRPTWDLVCHIEVGKKSGLLLVESKAHIPEMSEQDKKSKPTASEKSEANDRRIRENIDWANTVLGGLGVGDFSLSADDHYQLANRLTYSTKLATEGVSIVLLYLGWLRSTDWPADYFRDDAHWQGSVRRYLDGTVPTAFPEKVFSFPSGGSLRMLIRSLEARRPR